MRSTSEIWVDIVQQRSCMAYAPGAISLIRWYMTLANKDRLFSIRSTSITRATNAQQRSCMGYATDSYTVWVNGPPVNADSAPSLHLVPCPNTTFPGIARQLKLTIMLSPTIERYAAKRIVVFIWRAGLCPDDLGRIVRAIMIKRSALSISPLTGLLEKFPSPWNVEVKIVQIPWFPGHVLICICSSFPIHCIQRIFVLNRWCFRCSMFQSHGHISHNSPFACCALISYDP